MQGAEMKTGMRAVAMVGLFLVLAILPSQAATSCTVTTAGEAFGNYNPPANVADLTTGTITVTCKGSFFANVSYTISLSRGSGTFASRQMASGANSLGYNVYSDSAMTTIWGDGTSGTSVVSDSYRFYPATTVTRSYTVYGRIPNNQTAARTGSYSDNLTVTVTFQ
jgi:spore coat protein U-like protein